MARSSYRLRASSYRLPVPYRLGGADYRLTPPQRAHGPAQGTDARTPEGREAAFRFREAAFKHYARTSGRSDTEARELYDAWVVRQGRKVAREVRDAA